MAEGAVSNVVRRSGSSVLVCTWSTPHMMPYIVLEIHDQVPLHPATDRHFILRRTDFRNLFCLESVALWLDARAPSLGSQEPHRHHVGCRPDIRIFDCNDLVFVVMTLLVPAGAATSIQSLHQPCTTVYCAISHVAETMEGIWGGTYAYSCRPPCMMHQTTDRTVGLVVCRGTRQRCSRCTRTGPSSRAPWT